MEGKYAEKVLETFANLDPDNSKQRVFIAPDGWSLNTELLGKYTRILKNRFIGLFPTYGISKPRAVFDSDSCKNIMLSDILPSGYDIIN